MGVAKGSVSTKLGTDILKVLCSKKEVYKRFAAGVGLPNLVEFYCDEQNTPAWPRASSITLKHIYENIYKKASSRSSMEGYARFRSALSAFCRQLTPLSGLQPCDTLDVKELMRTLPARIKMLAGK